MDHENISNKKTEYKNPKSNRWKIIIVGVIVLSIIAYYLITRFFSKNEYLNSYVKRYNSESTYLSRMKHINNNFVMDNNYLVGNKYVRKDFYKWNDRNMMTLDKSLSLALSEYLEKNNIANDDFSMSLVTLKSGDRFNFSEKKDRQYNNLEKLLLNMILIKEIDKGNIKLDDKMTLKEVDLTAKSVFFTEASIGVTYPIEELMKLSFLNGDIPARNMLHRFIVDKIKVDYEDLVLRDFSISISDGKTNSEEVLNLAREFYNNSTTYKDLLVNTSSKENELLFLKYIVKKNSSNYYYSGQEINYDFGFVNGEISYIYSISTEGMSKEQISEIGDLVDRKVNEYYLLKNI